MGKSFLIDYDDVNDSLYVYKKDRVKGSLDVGNYIIDVNMQKQVCGIEILNARELLKNSGVKDPRTALKTIKSAAFNTVYKPDAVVIYAILLFDKEKVSTSIAVPMTIKA